MANTVSGINPLFFDTAGATSARSDALWINAIIWDSGASGAAGNVVLLHDAANGNVVFQATLAVAKDVVIFKPAKPFQVKGLYLTTMTNGTLLVYTS